MVDETSSSSAALHRMKAAADRSTGPVSPGPVSGSRPEEPADGHSSARRSDGPSGEQVGRQDERPDGRGVEAVDRGDRGTPGHRAPEGVTAAQARLRHANLREPVNPVESLNEWLDGLGEPDWDKVSQAIYESPAHAKAAYEQAKVRLAEERERRAEERRQAEIARREAAERAEAERREAERLAEEERLEAERLAAERAEAERLEAERRAREQARLEAQRRAEEEARLEAERRLEAQRAEEEALRLEMERQEQEEWLRRQRERETWALQAAAREADGTDWVPPAERRPLLEERGEDLTDAELLDRARIFLPEWRHRYRILEKAQAIEAATLGPRSAPSAYASPEAYGDDGDFWDHVGEPEAGRYIPPYNLPSREPDPLPGFLDLLRQITVTIAWLLFVAGGIYGLGFLGEDPTGPWLHDLHGGRFAGGYSMLSMASWAMLVWPLLWLALGVYTIHQWMPSQAAAARQRTTGWRVSGAMVAAVAWFVIARSGVMLGAELVVWLALTSLLVGSIHQLNLYTARTPVERVITDGMIGLFTGWAVIYAATNTSIWLQSLGLNLLWIPGAVWAVLTIVVVVWGTAMMAMTERGRITIALGLTWGLVAILVPRLVGSMHSVWVAIVAAMGLFVVLLATENRRYRINHAEHRAALGHAVDDV